MLLIFSLKWQWFSILIVYDNGVAQLRLNQMNRNGINSKESVLENITTKETELQWMEQATEINIKYRTTKDWIEIYVEFAFPLIAPLVTWGNCKRTFLKSGTFDWHLRASKKKTKNEKNQNQRWLFLIFCHRCSATKNPPKKSGAFILPFIETFRHI